MIKLVLVSIAMLAVSACASASVGYIPEMLSKESFMRWQNGE
jgi:hypothetical protein